MLADVAAKRIDVIVVYKVDRLTRSLADFAKLVELFDAHSVSFVSVTQSFNTTTSMGRLTLNVLLSFAQFEREVTGERIRDKIAASKKKGMWMGGVVSLGYRVENRALHIVEDHAAIVQSLFRRYVKIGSVVRLKQALDAEGLRLPIRVDGAGRSTGGGSISRGLLYKILSNPIYVGRLAHKTQVHEGQHDGIVDRELWEEVQTSLRGHLAARKVRREREASDALLMGKLFDDRGNRMSPSWSRRGSKRWRYYVSQALLQGDRTKAGTIARVSAPEIENRIIEAVSKLGTVSSLGWPLGGPRGDRDRRVDRAQPIAVNVPADADEELTSDRCVAIRRLIGRVTLERTTIRIALSQNIDDDGEAQTLALPWTPPSPYRRREIILGSNAESAIARPMRQGARRVLVDALRKAHRWLEELLADPRLTVEAIGSREGKSERSIETTLSLAFLAPDLVKAAVDGRLPRGFGLTRLTGLPIAWPDQWQALGLMAAARG